MIQPVETLGDVSLDEPRRAPPPGVDRLQGGVRSPAWTETMGAVGEPRLVVRLQQQAEHLLQQFVRPGRQPERALLVRSLLLDVDPPHRCPPVALRPERTDDRLD